MNFLEERIVKDGVVKKGNVLKVDSFLNHQMDIELFDKMGEEFKRRFARPPASALPASSHVISAYRLFLRRNRRASTSMATFTSQRSSPLRTSARIRSSSPRNS